MLSISDPSQVDQQWQPRINGARAVVVKEILEDVGRRLLHETGSGPALDDLRDPHLWQPAALANGFPGLALFGLALAKVFPDREYVAAAGRSLKHAASATQLTSVTTPGMFGGAAGLAFTAEMMARHDERYRAPADRTLEKVVDLVLSRNWSVPRDGLSFVDYDVISGATGILRYLLMVRTPVGPSVDEAIGVLLDYLVLIATVAGPGGLPGWFVASKRLNQNALQAKAYPHGFLDLGLAHGVSGILAVTALAWTASRRVTRQEETIARLAYWLLDHRKDDEWGVNWPSVIPIDADGSPAPLADLKPFGTAWCYGSVGILRALWLAGRALGNDLFTDTAVEAVRATVRRPASFRPGPGSVNLCHGHAGQLAVLLRFAHETELPDFDSRIEMIVDRIVASYSADYVFGFKNEAESGELTDDPGLLNGAAGVCMALAAAVGSGPPEWDRVILNS